MTTPNPQTPQQPPAQPAQPARDMAEYATLLNRVTAGQATAEEAARFVASNPHRLRDRI
jgi:hypothetical protein